LSLAICTPFAARTAAGAGATVLRFDVVAFSAETAVVVDLAIRIEGRVIRRNWSHTHTPPKSVVTLARIVPNIGARMGL
jgi:hypothetical protein